MTFALVVTAIRRHPFSTLLTTFLIILLASLFAMAVPIALALWIASTLIMVELWCALEPFILHRLRGFRPPTHAERELLRTAFASDRLEAVIVHQPDLAIGRGLRCLAVNRDLLDLLDERPLSGLLSQAAASSHAADLAGVALVWLGNLPLLVALCLTRVVGQLGRLLGVLLGESLVLPLVLWPGGGFVRWSGRLFGSAMVGLLSSMLISAGLAGAGVALMLAWPVVSALQALLAWESRRAERIADLATIDAGLGAELLEALEFLTLAEPRPTPSGALGILFRPGARLTDRADWIRRTLYRQ